MNEKRREVSPQEQENRRWQYAINQLKDGGYMNADGSIAASSRAVLEKAGWDSDQVAEAQRRAQETTTRKQKNVVPMVSAAEEDRQIGQQIAELEAKNAREADFNKRQERIDLIARLKQKQAQAKAA
ncbi:hypothetical protein CO057_03810 [Candidatus Uhrbacteria bacterium CG_4_9_14_0_2_um_filter_41_50]|uniref:Uncharacterized protein n=1 Tax=Candidatus Uhrbacteria bacterium CG_4_9_14_0_2_um_filter_41_50 TaxID=1975031 RepID=A0A2M8ENJ6_9BACT|nr:MAG: hypothetical protein COZ45_00185 [Candidatus Uhrbacteria bacterium CG_4_10_14_3_um_filter_41_21]PIZ55010.1 MAG: hypothetical protein COY24_02015 [Candidatus Uhrbacteria bacterium CG_4_10_14_0_2_um_filter_41_21]PJB84776.1 MAG: hypothetical protein CO086_01870 [Candidatus Uhrbacteria bacterium CG_4_9_14_0_8_um_filter_41_16]PJC24261.1 MAG: hypothetical protein CO057_03810 [Candidatus Uhrbacteria bacterium CG_4_9_14_0_2_um_filter_41_50]PJE74934.1 MAG: hypothetical protein COV03_02870 [Candi